MPIYRLQVRGESANNLHLRHIQWRITYAWLAPSAQMLSSMRENGSMSIS